jgi:hypothetical protein
MVQTELNDDACCFIVASMKTVDGRGGIIERHQNKCMDPRETESEDTLDHSWFFVPQNPLPKIAVITRTREIDMDSQTLKMSG